MQDPQPERLDATDRAILTALTEDGRLTNSALARRVHLAESTCAYRVAISLPLPFLSCCLQPLAELQSARHICPHSWQAVV